MDKKQSDTAIKLLKKIAQINSGSLNKAGVNKVGTLLMQEFMKLGFQTFRFPDKNFGALIYLVSPHTNPNKPRLLLSGHTDTVFEPTSNFTEVRENKDFIYGPGVNDMKGGLVIMLEAVRAIIATGGVPANLGIILSPDEELGSQAHQERLAGIYKTYDFAIVMEGVGNNWELCNERKGIAQLTLRTSGEAGHAGHWANRRANAIDTLAACISSVIGMANLDKGTSINTGIVSGGGKLNIVADKAEAKFDIRYIRPNELARIEQGLRILQKQYRCTYQLQRFFEPMQITDATKRLMKYIDQAGVMIGRDIVYEQRGSSSDGNYIASFGLGVIDGFGSKGYDIHTTRERMVKRSLNAQATLLAEVLRSVLR